MGDDNLLLIAGGEDVFGGGHGRDRIGFNVDGPVVIDLMAVQGPGSGVGPDIIEEVEVVIGTIGDDTLIGVAADNYLNGLEGDDHLEGEDGDDLLDGFDGLDFLDGGNGTDECLGGETVLNCEAR